MNELEIPRTWNIISGKLKQKGSHLTDDDLRYGEGKQDELMGRLQKRTGKSRENVAAAIRECCP